jgi:hypothetical protein
MHRICLAFLTLGFVFVPMHPACATNLVIVAAGEFDRQQTIVTFPSKRVPGRGILAMRDKDRRLIPAQAGSDGTVCFVLNHLAKGTESTFELLRYIPIGNPEFRVVAQREGDLVKLSVDGRPVFHYQTTPGPVPRPDIPAVYRHGASLHPVFSPAGAVVTGDYPADHYWHRGVWFAWTSTEFEGRKPDFWNMGKGDKLTSGVEFDSLAAVWSGPVHGGFQARHRFVDRTGPEPRTALFDDWQVTAYRLGGEPARWVFDLVSTQRCASASPLRLPRYRYGGLAWRGAAAWDRATNVHVLREGGGAERDTGAGDPAARSHWCHMGGWVDGKVAGMTVFAHPSNPRSPQPLRTNRDIPLVNFAPSQLGDWEIAPGQALVHRFRFVAQDGRPDPAELNRLWNDWANPPICRVLTDGP